MEDLRPQTGSESGKRSRVPFDVSWEIQDLVRPIILRRKRLWQLGLVLIALVCVGVAAWYAYVRAPTGDEVLADMIDASGGMDAWWAVKEGKFTRYHYVYDEQENVIDQDKVTFYFQQHDKYRMLVESEDENGHIWIGADDQGYWAMKDGRRIHPATAAKDLDMMCESEYCTPLCAAEMAMYRFAMPFKLADPGIIPVFAGEETVNGHRTRVLDVTYDEGVGEDRWVVYADAHSNLIRKIEHYASADGATPPETVYWSDFRPVNGIQISHARTYYRSNGKKLEEYIIQDVEFNAMLPATLFARP